MRDFRCGVSALSYSILDTLLSYPSTISILLPMGCSSNTFDPPATTPPRNHTHLFNNRTPLTLNYSKDDNNSRQPQSVHQIIPQCSERLRENRDALVLSIEYELLNGHMSCGLQVRQLLRRKIREVTHLWSGSFFPIAKTTVSSQVSFSRVNVFSPCDDCIAPYSRRILRIVPLS